MLYASFFYIIIIDKSEEFMKYKIVTEASVDMPDSFAKENDITILPIELNFAGELFPEGLPNDEFYEKMKTTGIIPKTSQPNQYKFETALSPYCNKEDWFVLTIVISSNLAGTIAQAKNAVEALKMKNVYICDSEVTTFAEGALIMEIVKYIKEKNPTPQEVIDELERLKRKIRLVAAVSDLKYLRLGGRISGAVAALGTVLNMKPIIALEGGRVVNKAKKRGEQANIYMVEEVLKNRDKAYPLYFGYSAIKKNIENFVQKYKDKLEVNPDKIEYHSIGCVVGTHAGPGAYGMVYFAK